PASTGELLPEAVNAILTTAYVILRDTGRRPAEVAGLDLDCLEFDNGEYQMVWHNMKADVDDACRSIDMWSMSSRAGRRSEPGLTCRVPARITSSLPSPIATGTSAPSTSHGSSDRGSTRFPCWTRRSWDPMARRCRSTGPE